MLKRACKSLSVRAVLADRAEVVTATTDALGAQPIANMLFEQIRNADAFIADVTIVHQGERPSPNPNVLVETGYALHALNDTRVVLLMNEVHGRPEQLLFDLRSRLVVTYSYRSEDEPAAARTTLVKSLEDILGRVLTLPRVTRDIRIELAACDVYYVGRNEKGPAVLRITIRNFSSHPVRISSWHFVMKTGEKNAMPIEHQLQAPIPARDAVDIQISLNFVLQQRPVAVAMSDSLGRTFTTEAGAMEEALKLRTDEGESK